MTRTAAFDRETVIRAARDVFWREGYAETALPTLEKATGLNRSSIYNSFGSKRGLFDAAVNNYLDEVVRPRLHPLTQESVEPTALSDYLSGLSKACEKLESAPGCLLVNATGTTLAHDPEVCRVITNYLEELRSAVTAGVRAAKPHLDSPAQSRLVDAITAMTISSFTLVRIDRSQAIRTLDTARKLLTADTNES
ncbi:TetR/AcrR family transcriptional regulator [Corynebacterium casei]|uniref:TetR/AcrR family transcriptional regulator n=1 Tax=Corynebacterium casei TaxID=160386 RepID=UPI003FD3CAFC